MENVTNPAVEAASAATGGPDRGAGPKVPRVLHQHGPARRHARRHERRHARRQGGIPEPGLPRVRENRLLSHASYSTMCLSNIMHMPLGCTC